MQKEEHKKGAFAQLLWKDMSPITHSMKPVNTLGITADKAIGLGSLSAHVVDFDRMGITTPKEKAIVLLKAAAEVEHQFIVQYLYAHYCGGSTAAELDAEEQKFLMIIAQEEMGHLLSVQNLLVTLGEPHYLERNQPLPEDLNPTPFRLSPFQTGFIVRFLIAESGPDFVVTPEMEKFLKTENVLLDQIHHVGAIYAMLYWLFQDGSGASGSWTIPLGTDMSGFAALGHLSDDDFADVVTVEANLSVAGDWRAKPAPSGTGKNILVMPPKGFVDKTGMRKAALEAIHAIAGQGEGPVALVGGEPSHAERLAKIYDKLKVIDPQFISPFPVNPYLGDRPGAPPEDQITFGDAKDKAGEVNKQYEILLLRIALSILPGSTDRKTPAKRALSGMGVLDSTALELVDLQRQAGGDPAQKAGPPFTFPEAGIPMDKVGIEHRLTELGVL